MTCSCANTLFGDSARDEALNLRRDRHLGFAIYKGNMNTPFTYVDANNAYVVARSSNEHNVSASPSFINNDGERCRKQKISYGYTKIQL